MRDNENFTEKERLCFEDKNRFVEVEKVAEMFNEQFWDNCPCNFNNNDEWLPEVCEYANTCDCPCIKGWEQFVKHYGERKELVGEDE
jgi:hypothetical protein